MCSETVIDVAGVSKCFEIYARPHDRLKQYVLPAVERFFGFPPRATPYFREFWALRDIAFHVRAGQTLGIIGRNGSGKSTLLQILCGTLAATSGRISTRGRIAALLELGSGFNPEFTGRENVYLNASVLGLSREQIHARFDAIAAFADISDFMEQPVKTYSSGMFVRLAFAVIAHVDADILVIDEALAVGDAVFTQKCMRFLRQFRERGTLLFVSHDMGSINALCDAAIWLDHGQMRLHGSTQEVTKAYGHFCSQQMAGNGVQLNTFQAEPEMAVTAVPLTPMEDKQTQIEFYDNIQHAEGWRSEHAEITRVQLQDPFGKPIAVVHGGEKITLVINGVAHRDLIDPIFGFFVKDRLGQALFGENTCAHVAQPNPIQAGSLLRAEFIFVLPMLQNGDYSLTVALAEGDIGHHVHHHWLHDAAILRVHSPALRWGIVGVPFERVQLTQMAVAPRQEIAS